ncbi:MAG TPA: hypothetical protein VKT73_15245 [Xanthobacteraceae bacterium]|nr:hypothetical protein [Xanthobacteraceae bacterium]
MANPSMRAKIEKARKQFSERCHEAFDRELYRAVFNPHHKTIASYDDALVVRVPCAGVKPYRAKTYGNGARRWSNGPVVCWAEPRDELIKAR